MDGSPPGYFLREGHGNGIRKWIVRIPGGAWCYDKLACYQRAFNQYGSTRYKLGAVPLDGLYSGNETKNQEFHDWNMVSFIYCDGSSFTGMREEPVHVNGTALYFRGKRILDYLMRDLLKRGLEDAREVLLTGDSAGGLAVLIHADYIKSLLPERAKMLAVSDAGYFVDMQTSHGDNRMRKKFSSVVRLHNSTGALHPKCVSNTVPKYRWKCMFPQYFFKYIDTPVFVVQPAYDIWQIMSSLNIACFIPNYGIISSVFKNVTHRAGSPRDGDKLARESRGPSYLAWRNTRRSIQNGARASSTSQLEPFHWRWQYMYSGPAECTKSELKKILSIHATTANALVPVLRKGGSGLFLSPCLDHSQAKSDLVWNTVKVRGKNIRQAFWDWFTEMPGNHIYIGEYLAFESCVP